MLKSATHIHSTYSDGEFTLAELREVYMAAGYDCICMTDHAEFFDEAKLQAYQRECEALSDENFRLHAGLEFECEQRMHILGLGVTTLAHTLDPQAVIQHIRDKNGLSVIAHPMDTMFTWIETFEVLPDGIETWNSKYDGRFAPRPGTFELLNRLQTRQPHMRAFYGQDLHWKKQFRGLFYQIDSPSSLSEDLFTAFRQGNYFAHKDELKLPFDGQLSNATKAEFGKINAQYHKKRRLVKNLKKSIDRIGITIPEVIKTQLRRVF